MKSQLLEITQNYRICAHPKTECWRILHCSYAGLVISWAMLAVWESNKPLFPKLHPTADLMLGPGEPALGTSTSHCEPHTFEPRSLTIWGAAMEAL